MALAGHDSYLPTLDGSLASRALVDAALLSLLSCACYTAYIVAQATVASDPAAAIA